MPPGPAQRLGQKCQDRGGETDSGPSAAPPSQPGHGRPHCTACSRPGLCAGPQGSMGPSASLGLRLWNTLEQPWLPSNSESVFPQSSSRPGSRVLLTHLSAASVAASGCQQGRRLKGCWADTAALTPERPGQQQLPLPVCAHVLSSRACTAFNPTCTSTGGNCHHHLLLFR